MNIALLTSPHFIVKYYLLKRIAYITRKYRFAGSILDIGCGEKPYRHLFRDAKSYTGIDFKSYSRNREHPRGEPDTNFPNSYTQNYRLPYDEETFDHVVSFQVLEHHPVPHIMIKEARRVMKTKGLLLLSFPFIWGLHEIPNDYCRFTEYYIKRVLKENDFKTLEIIRIGSLPSTISILLNDYLIHFMGKNKVLYFIGLFCFIPLLVFSYAAILLDRIFPSREIFLNYIVVARAC